MYLSLVLNLEREYICGSTKALAESDKVYIELRFYLLVVTLE